MGFFKNTEIKELVALEGTVKQRMKEIGELSDVGDRLLKYKELRKSIDDATDFSRTHYENIYHWRSSGHYSKLDIFRDNGGIAGSVVGGVGGVVGAILTGIFITAPVLGAGLAVLGGLAFLAGSVGAGVLNGKKLGSFFFNHALSAEDKHHNRMRAMSWKIWRTTNKLTSPGYKNIEAVGASSKLEEVKIAFPDFAQNFDKAAKLNEKREALLHPKAPEAPAEVAPVAEVEAAAPVAAIEAAPKAATPRRTTAAKRSQIQPLKQ